MTCAVVAADAVVVLVLLALVVRACRRDGWQWVAHNVVAHPLLSLAPSVGERLHDATIPEDDLDDQAPAPPRAESEVTEALCYVIRDLLSVNAPDIADLRDVNEWAMTCLNLDQRAALNGATGQDFGGDAAWDSDHPFSIYLRNDARPSIHLGAGTAGRYALALVLDVAHAAWHLRDGSSAQAFGLDVWHERRDGDRLAVALDQLEASGWDPHGSDTDCTDDEPAQTVGGHRAQFTQREASGWSWRCTCGARASLGATSTLMDAVDAHVDHLDSGVR